MRNWVAMVMSVLFVGLVVGGVYVYMPSPVTGLDISAEEQDFSEERSRVLHRVPHIDLDHYRLSDERYWDFVMDGYISIGKEDPTSVEDFYKEFIRANSLGVFDRGVVFVEEEGIIEEDVDSDSDSSEDDGEDNDGEDNDADDDNDDDDDDANADDGSDDDGE